MPDRLRGEPRLQQEIGQVRAQDVVLRCTLDGPAHAVEQSREIHRPLLHPPGHPRYPEMGR